MEYFSKNHQFYHNRFLLWTRITTYIMSTIKWAICQYNPLYFAVNKTAHERFLALSFNHMERHKC